MIESANLDLDIKDEPYPHPVVFLQLTGDFVHECEKYLSNESIEILTLELPRNVAENLHDQLTKVLWG